MMVEKKSERKKPIHIPFKYITICPECGSTDLRVLHNRMYPSEDGWVRFVIYRCSRGHETRKRQLVIKGDLPPLEGWY